jgi:hypothetical protein
MSNYKLRTGVEMAQTRVLIRMMEKVLLLVLAEERVQL